MVRTCFVHSIDSLKKKTLLARLSCAPHPGKYKERELQEQFIDLLGRSPDSDDEGETDAMTSSSINVLDLIAKVSELMPP